MPRSASDVIRQTDRTTNSWLWMVPSLPICTKRKSTQSEFPCWENEKWELVRNIQELLFKLIPIDPNSTNVCYCLAFRPNWSPIYVTFSITLPIYQRDLEMNSNDAYPFWELLRPWNVTKKVYKAELLLSKLNCTCTCGAHPWVHDMRKSYIVFEMMAWHLVHEGSGYYVMLFIHNHSGVTMYH